MLRSVVTTSRRSTWIALATSRRVDSSSVSFSTTTSRALSVRQTLKRVAVGSGLTLLGAGTLGATYLSFSTSESAAGARRTLCELLCGAPNYLVRVSINIMIASTHGLFFFLSMQPFGVELDP